MSKKYIHPAHFLCRIVEALKLDRPIKSATIHVSLDSAVSVTVEFNVDYELGDGLIETLSMLEPCKDEDDGQG